MLHIVDVSHVHLFLNFWVVARELNAWPKDWAYSVACLAGDEDGTALDRIVSSLHGPGCAQILTGGLHRRRVYYAKMSAVVTAFKALPQQGSAGLLVLDLDLVLLRNPSTLLFGADAAALEFDIVSSRDHGPAQLEFSETWGGARFCTGFIYFRHRWCAPAPASASHATLRPLIAVVRMPLPVTYLNARIRPVLVFLAMAFHLPHPRPLLARAWPLDACTAPRWRTSSPTCSAAWTPAATTRCSSTRRSPAGGSSGT